MEQLTFNLNFCPRCGSNNLMSASHIDYDYTRCIEALRGEGKLTLMQVLEWRKARATLAGQELLDEFNRIIELAWQTTLAQADDEADLEAYETMLENEAA